MVFLLPFITTTALNILSIYSDISVTAYFILTILLSLESLRFHFITTIALKIVCGKSRHMKMLLSYRICPGIGLRLSFLKFNKIDIFHHNYSPYYRFTSKISNTDYLSFKSLSILRQDNFNFSLLQPQSITFTLFTPRDLDPPSSQLPRFRIRVFTSHTPSKIYFIIVPLAFVPTTRSSSSQPLR